MVFLKIFFLSHNALSEYFLFLFVVFLLVFCLYTMAFCFYTVCVHVFLMLFLFFSVCFILFWIVCLKKKTIKLDGCEGGEDFWEEMREGKP